MILSQSQPEAQHLASWCRNDFSVFCVDCRNRFLVFECPS
jgi:hypothetical protein